MTISIPNGFWDKYYEAVDFFIDDDHIGRSCTIVYPPKRIACVNCVKPVGTTNTSVYRHGGPMPFDFGSCPMCGGSGYKEEEVTDVVRLRVYWNRADWIRITGRIVAADAEIMILGYMKDLKKIRQASNILLAKDNGDGPYRASITGQPTPWGFGRDRYFQAFLKGA